MRFRSFAAFSFFLLTSAATAHAAPCTFRMDILDVGQGDSTFIQTPDCHTALIDGGDSGSGAVIRNHLASLGVSSLDLVVVTHYHQDHLAGIVELAQGAPIPVGLAVDHGGSYPSNTYQSYAALYGAKRHTAQLGEVFGLGSQVRLEVISTDADGLDASDENSLSVGLKLTYGQLDVLLAGDLTGNGSGATQDLESRVAPDVGPVEIYHVDHHGSSGSSNDMLLSLIQPEVSLISLGWDNTYGHPGPDTLDRLEQAGSLVYMTEDPQLRAPIGPISVTSPDGVAYTVSQAGGSSTFTAYAGAPDSIQSPSAVTVFRGTSSSSSAAPLSADDGSSWQTTASSRNGVYQIDLAAQVTLASTRPSAFTVVINERYSTPRDQTLSLYVPATDGWESVGTTAIGSSDQTLRYRVTNPQRYLTANGTLQVRVSANTRSSSYKIYADALFVAWEP